MLKKPLNLILLVAVVAVVAIGIFSLVNRSDDTPVAAESVTVLVTQIVEHEALDSIRNGILAGLNDAGYSQDDNLTFEFQSAQGNPAISGQIAREFIGQAPDVLIGISTPSAQSLASATTDIPVIFSAVTDPIGAGLITSMQMPGGNVTGLSDFPPINEHLDLMRQILPDATRIGIVYNSGEDNSISIVNAVSEQMEAHGFTELVEATVTNSTGVKAAAESLIGRIDLIYALTDNTIASTISVLTQTANEAGIPVIASENSFVGQGALASIGFDYTQVGYQTAELVARVLAGESPADIPSKVAVGTDIAVNTGVAALLGISLPQDLVDAASVVIE